MTFLVTGCAGFIGSACTRALAAQFPAAKLVGLDNLCAGKRSAVSEGVAFVEGSIEDEVLVERVFAEHRPDYVLHFAALPRVAFSMRHPVETTRVNILGTAILLEAARKHGVKRFVFSSSSAVYGASAELPTQETAMRAPNSPYGAQKLAGEELCGVYARSLGLDTVCLRYFNVYGPGQRGTDPYSTVIAAWLESALVAGSRRAYLEGDGSQSRDFCFVEDVVQANITAMMYPQPLQGIALNIAGGKAVSLREIRALLEASLHAPLDLEARPARSGDVQHTLADTRLAYAVMGFRANTSLEEGIRQTVAWFQGVI